MPIAHAAGLDYCGNAVCSSIDQNGKKQQDTGKVGKADFHCCGNHIAAHNFQEATGIENVISVILRVKEPEDMASLSVPPLLEPPSHI